MPSAPGKTAWSGPDSSMHVPALKFSPTAGANVVANFPSRTLALPISATQQTGLIVSHALLYAANQNKTTNDCRQNGR